MSHGHENARNANSSLRELVVCSLEPWDDVWRRNQFFADALLRRNTELRILYVEPPSDPLFDVRTRRVPTLPRVRSISDDGRLRAFRPLKPVPRRFGRVTDRALINQVRFITRRIGFSRPSLWINDVTYAPLIRRTGWPSLYDVTDDWLLAPFPVRELERLRGLDALALAEADEVVVCSPALAASRGATREVTLIPNGVDIDHFRAPQARPTDLPPGLTAVYVGSLHDSRLDVGLVVELATDLPNVTIVLIGPDSLEPATRRVLEALPNLVLAGSRPYEVVPAYLQHADLVIVPHNVSPFTESLDPIKAYECLALDKPTLATPVAGFREHAGELDIADRAGFATRAAEMLARPTKMPRRSEPITWDARSRMFERMLEAASCQHPAQPRGNTLIER